MRSARAATAACGALLLATLALSGGSRADPATPPALPGMPAPFLGTALIGNGVMVGAVDSYGDVVDLRQLGHPGRALVQIPSGLQSAGTVPQDSGIVARADVGRTSLPLWRAESVHQAYVPGTSVLRTTARFGHRTTTFVRRIGGPRTARSDRRWLAASRPLAAGAPRWARRMYRRSLLVLRALTDSRTGATIAGARDGWAYVWPRDAATVAIALAAAGHRREARRIVAFLERLDLSSAARFEVTGATVEGRGAQGDAAGWVRAAARAVGDPVPNLHAPWREASDYQEKGHGDYLGNALASTPSTVGSRGSSEMRAFELDRGGTVLVRQAGNAGSGLDAAAAWAVRPFPHPGLFAAARRTMLRLVAAGGRFGITPSENWPDQDPWTAPTAWCAWSLAALGDRRAAESLMADLRRAATPLGLFPERVDARTGIPRSTTPLAWSHAFAILALRELW